MLKAIAVSLLMLIACMPIFAQQPTYKSIYQEGPALTLDAKTVVMWRYELLMPITDAPIGYVVYLYNNFGNVSDVHIVYREPGQPVAKGTFYSSTLPSLYYQPTVAPVVLQAPTLPPPVTPPPPPPPGRDQR